MTPLSTHAFVVTAMAAFFAIGCGGAIDPAANDGASSSRVNGEPGADAAPPPSSPPAAPRSCPDAEQTVVASGVGNPSWIAVDATHLYFASLFDARLQRVAKSGGPVQTLFTGLASIDLAVTSTTTSLVFAHVGGLFRLPKTGGTAVREEGYSRTDGITSIAADETGLALLTSEHLVRCKRSEPCTQENVSGGPGAKIAMDDDWIYYRRPKGNSYALVRTARRAITSVDEELVDGISLVGNTVVFDDRIYFSSTDGTTATLSSVPSSQARRQPSSPRRKIPGVGGSPSTLARSISCRRPPARFSLRRMQVARPQRSSRRRSRH